MKRILLTILFLLVTCNAWAGTVTQANIRLSTIAGKAFIYSADATFASALTGADKGLLLTITDSAGKTLRGFISTTGSSESLSSNLTPTNYDFAADSGWTKGTNWVIADGVASQSGSNTYLKQGTAANTGMLIKSTYTVVSRSAGSVYAVFASPTTQFFTARNTTGTFTEYKTVKSATNEECAFYSNSFNGSIDNAYFYQVNAPDNTGVWITSTKGGGTDGDAWYNMETGFNVDDTSYTYGITSELATPNFSSSAGTYNNSLTLTLSAGAGETICYTTDGSTPAASTPGTCSAGNTYSTALSIAATTTVKALATKSGETNSSVESRTYTIKVATPTASVATGATLVTGRTIALQETTTTGSSIRYAWDGTANCTSSTVYSSAITAQTGTLHIIGCKTGFDNSTEATFDYTVRDAVAYYVKHDTGADTNNGTSADTPWAHAPGMTDCADTCASATIAIGDTIYLHSSGTWAGAVPVLVAKVGAIYKGKVFGGTSTRAIIQASSAPNSGGVVQVFESYVTLDGIEVDANDLYTSGINIGYSSAMTADIRDITVNDCLVHNGKNTETEPEYYYGLHVSNHSGYTTRNVTITDSKIYDWGHEGIALYPSWRSLSNSVDTVLIRGNEIYNTGLVPATNRGSASSAGLNSDNVTYEFNYIHDNAVIGFLTDTYSYDDDYGSPNNLTFRYNILKNNGVGVSVHPGTKGWWSGDGVFYGNLFIDSPIFLGGYPYNDTSIKFYNNTMYGTAENTYGLQVYTNATGTAGIELKNNIFYITGVGSASRCVYDKGEPLLEANHTNNLYFAADSGNVVTSGTTDYTGATVGTWETVGVQTADPTFTGSDGVDLPTGFSGTYGSNMVPNKPYFSLQAGSPALNNGAVLPSPYSKAINNAGTDSTYTRGTAWDIGAYEYTLDGGATIVNTGAVFSGCTF